MMSAEVSLFVVLAGVIVVLLVYGYVAIFIRPQVLLRRERRRLQALSVLALAAEAVQTATAGGFRDRFADAQIFASHASWDRASLLAALDELYTQLDAEDRRTGQVGREGQVFQFYDCGLASIREVVAEET